MNLDPFTNNHDNGPKSCRVNFVEQSINQIVINSNITEEDIEDSQVDKELYTQLISILENLIEILKDQQDKKNF
ncbi:28078_t:CDS:2 [Dentiscutata erythropus]|uniref:28078_t:CDS:1 n=1 Tax=Dentiscutata erythropus TaxID=1348616 RepID=A0A9N9IQL2_9GLOM|nr:28078_t:CDS:2 [Dentiscutata erythropus]